MKVYILVYHEVVLCIMSKSHMLQSFSMFSLLMLFNNRKMGTMNLKFSVLVYMKFKTLGTDIKNTLHNR